MNQAQAIPYIPNTEIVAYDPFRRQLDEWKQQNASLAFDYEDLKQNKEARSHIYKLRQSKAAVERVRKDEKAASLEYGRKVDAEAKEIIAEIEAMIDVHQRPLDEIEQREKERVAAIQARIDGIRKYQECSGHDSNELHNSLASLKALEIDEAFAEFKAQATEALLNAIRAQEAELIVAMQREAQQAELERLREEAAEREQKERDERIAREAAEKAKREAEESARRQREDAERKASAEREAAERREMQLRLEKEQAERRAAEAAQAERDRIAREDDERRAAELKREADRQHQAAIHADIIAGMAAYGVSEDLAKALITAIRKGEIQHIKIQY